LVVLAHAVIAQGDPADVDELVDFVKEQVQPRVDALPGSYGLSLEVNRDTGMIVVGTAWEDESALAGSEKPLAVLRHEALGVLAAKDSRIEILEPAVLLQKAPEDPGCWSRSTETRSPPELVQENITLFSSEVLPAIRQIPGTRTVALLVDRSNGHALSRVVYASKEALIASRERAARLREESVERLGAEVVDVVELEVVIAGIRPAPDLPAQGPGPSR